MIVDFTCNTPLEIEYATFGKRLLFVFGRVLLPLGLFHCFGLHFAMLFGIPKIASAIALQDLHAFM